MLAASLRQSAVDGKPRYINPRPVTNRDAIRNLRAFSAEYVECAPRSNFEPFTTAAEINPCLGWISFDGPALRAVFRHLWAPTYDVDYDAEAYCAIVYQFVPEGTLDDNVVLSHLDFFYLTGFVNVLFKEDNWRGSGILVDFSDILLPLAPEWDRLSYGKLVKRPSGMYDLEPKGKRTA